MTNALNYRLFGEDFTHSNDNVFPPYYASRSDELWSNPYLEQLRAKKRCDMPALDLLDVGTGSGITAIHWLLMMPEEIKSVTLTDNSPQALELAQSNINYHCRDYIFNAIKLRKPDCPALHHLKARFEQRKKGYTTDVDSLKELRRDLDIYLSQPDSLWQKCSDSPGLCAEIGCTIRIEHADVWPTKCGFDYIVFNGPHYDEEGNDKNLPGGVKTGIFDHNLASYYLFVEKLQERLKDKDSRAVLTFSDFSKEDTDAREPLKDPLVKLLRTAREKKLVATFLSVSEFNPDAILDILNQLPEVQQREVMLMKNVIFRKAPNDEPNRKDPEDEHKESLEHNVSVPTKIRFNLHKTVTGFLAAASEVADIYCTKTQITKELYDELNARMLTFYSMLCEQIGWAKGIENDCIVSGFSLPSWQDDEGAKYKHSSWTFGQKIPAGARAIFIEMYDKLIRSLTDEKEQYDQVKYYNLAALAPEKLVDTNIHRLEIRDHRKLQGASGYVDRNFAVPQRENKEAVQTKEAQVRYRIQLAKPASELLCEMRIEIEKQQIYTYFKESDNNIDDAHRGLVNQVINTSLLSFDISKAVHEKLNDSTLRNLSYCLFSRYSGSAKKSAVFYLLSSTEDLPFLQALRSFGRIANTAANNMLSRLAAQKAAMRAARTAVFARNFSHITGSHVISNPDFRNSLAGASLIYSLKARLDQSYNDFIMAENNMLATLQRPYKPQQLWENGTKALADARDKLGTGDVFLDNTRRFHEYLQGRFDFIARAIDDTKDLPEPVWFVQDLLRGFFNQTCYLNSLVADIGLRLENMEFFLIIEPNKPVHVGEAESQQQTTPEAPKTMFVARWKPAPPRTDSLPSGSEAPLELQWEPHTSSDHTTTEADQSIQACDKLVALPGGMIAAHAFYSILENLIRNSAKYGTLKINRQNSDSKYSLTIRLLRDDKENGHYRARIWDNYSSAKSIENKQLQQKLQKPFVTATGVPETEDLGLMEMQACAQLLCRSNENGRYPGPIGLEGEKPKFNLSIVAHNESSTGQRGANSESDALLAYELSFAIPTLLGCYSSVETQRHSSQFVCWSSDPGDLMKQSPFLFVIDGDSLKEDDKIQEYIKDRNNPASHASPSSRNPLPHRTLELYSNNGNNFNVSSSGSSKVKRIIDAKLHGQIFGCANNCDHQELVLKVYNAWLMEWKRHPKGPWHLWIGLERPKMQVQESWQHAEGILGSDEQFGKFVHLRVKAHSPGDDAFIVDSRAQSCEESLEPINDVSWDKYWEDEQEVGMESKRALLFDNHGNCFPEAYGVEKVRYLKGATRFYQKLSGSVSPDLFQMLSLPPKDSFSFRFFLYSLVEACLTNVVVVDERLAWSLVDGDGVGNANPNFAQDLMDHQKAGIFPIFRFRQQNASKSSESSGFYSSLHKERLRRSMQLMFEDNDQAEQTIDEWIKYEGIIYTSKNGSENSEYRPLQLITLVKTGESGVTFSLAQSHPNSSPSNRQEISPAGKGNVAAVTSQPMEAIQADVLLIHEGAMDILTSQPGVDWIRSNDQEHMDQYLHQLQALYKIAPIIIRTSGRGRKSQLLGEDLPFIEFGQVSSSLLTARNKFSLVRGLLGSVGSAPKNQTI